MVPTSDCAGARLCQCVERRVFELSLGTSVRLHADSRVSATPAGRPKHGATSQTVPDRQPAVPCSTPPSKPCSRYLLPLILCRQFRILFSEAKKKVIRGSEPPRTPHPASEILERIRQSSISLRIASVSGNLPAVSVRRDKQDAYETRSSGQTTQRVGASALP